MQIGVITNPNSRKNRGRVNRAAQLQSIIGDAGEVRETRQIEEIKPVLREFLRRRARYWVADGGDGALHWMVRAGLEILQEPEFAESGATLPLTLPTNGGTIDFVANNVGIKGRAEELLGTLRGALEAGTHVEEVEVDSMVIDAVEETASGPVHFRTYGFAAAAAGFAQRFYAKYYAHEDPNPRTIVKIVASTVATVPIGYTPLRQLKMIPRALREYAPFMFKPCMARVTVDQQTFPHTRCTAINIASMSLNLGNVFRLFNKADTPGQLHALVGATSPWGAVRQLPSMVGGGEFRGDKIIDTPCRELTMEAVGDELFAPIIDGEYYRNLRQISFGVGPRVRIPKLVAIRH
jgi:diacylglycerol kinase family enzyme